MMWFNPWPREADVTPTILRTLALAAALSGALAVGGCSHTTEAEQHTAAELYVRPAPSELVAAYHPVAIERVTGDSGEHLGWVRTDAVPGSNRTYRVLLDPDMAPVGYERPRGSFYEGHGGSLRSVGDYSQSEGLAKYYDARPPEILVSGSSARELAASGPLGTSRAGSVMIRGSADEMDDEEE